MASSVRLRGLSRRFPGADRPSLDRLDLEVAPGETVCLVGPSGCGKSTTLRLIAGLDRPDSGVIQIGERDVAGVPPQDRDVAMVFQGFALYPHLTVRKILAFPLEMRKVERGERERRVTEVADLLSIGRLLDRRPAELSGGEQQRVAMGRAIVRRPEVFLFDEPLSNLDAALRAELRRELGRLLGRLATTSLYVTHDQTEAMTLGQRIAVLREGRLEQLGAPRDLYDRPATLFVAAFFGHPPMNLLAARRDGDTCRVDGLSFPLPAMPAEADAITVGLRPEELRLGAGGPPDAVRGRGRVVQVEPHGADSHVEVELDGAVLSLRTPGFDAPTRGENVDFWCPTTALRWFDTRSGRAL